MIPIKKFGKHRRYFLVLIDIMIIILAYFFGEAFICDTVRFTPEQLYILFLNTILAIFIYEIILIALKLYNNITRYETGKDYLTYIVASVFSGVIVCAINTIFKFNLLSIKHNMSIAFFIGIALVSYRLIIKFLLLYNTERMLEDKQKENSKTKNKTDKRNLLIIGGGDATKIIIDSIKHTMRRKYNLIGIIDDNEGKIGYKINGVKVLGNRDKIIEISKEQNVNDIFFSIANIDAKNRKEILNLCQQTKARVRILPGVTEIISNKKLIENLKNVEIDDILGRDPIKLDNENIEGLIKDNTILVTGGGGSIGSELCRQIAKYSPKKLIIFDIYENNAYNIQMELQRNCPELDLDAIIGSVRDKNKVEWLFETYKPQVVFHAAAHKHVPLMEVSPLEAIKNNVFGTYNVVNASDKFGVKKFILISTDKAVNPTNIMGATKRLCEMIIQAKDKVSKTEYAAVRFGNVLGSNGSVVPLFKEQIEQGGPVTVTHKDIIRYFMTISEAVQLVLQAATYAEGGEIFVLDMGEPVKIYDLAISMIRLSGYEPNVDIQIKVTGLRPGEKLYEELLMGEEGLSKTDHEKIFIGKPLDMKMKEVEEKLKTLKTLITDENKTINDVRDEMKKIVPTFRETGENNNK